MDLQLAAIAEVVALADRIGVDVWLRGGWAMDFFLGRVTRPHVDVDWFVHVDQAPRLVDALLAAGHSRLVSGVPEAQADLARDGVEHGVAYFGTDPTGAPVVPAGPYAGERWPADLLDGPRATLGGVTARVVHPRAQVEIKRMMPVWVPGLRRRPKDAGDIALLLAALDGGVRDFRPHLTE
ncbi:hypothetical protein V5P93_001494 [Actinokineospora auranticolor]|uniref:Aminoglycoside-2''-adenylyltransferase n=1 Tax=Actinokineospora auranticolor TaxID=155976 RepID=A0A2S6GV69_9PSEU|nr:hypothetical protein [Actinokineospora auranticolor]PPK69118.1 aminoglycoside-2''-adenylyltransferase [Actinokineospora auranticolor]